MDSISRLHTCHFPPLFGRRLLYLHKVPFHVWMNSPKVNYANPPGVAKNGGSFYVVGGSFVRTKPGDSWKTFCIVHFSNLSLIEALCFFQWKWPLPMWISRCDHLPVQTLNIVQPFPFPLRSFPYLPHGVRDVWDTEVDLNWGQICFITRTVQFIPKVNVRFREWRG